MCFFLRLPRFLFMGWLVSLLGALLVSPLPAAPPPVRIMPLGDSITLGSFIPGGYRAPLYQMLTNAGYTVAFVGTLTGNGAPNQAELRHEGHTGYRIEQIDAGFSAWANADPDPDIILLLIGVNDFAQNEDVTSTANRLDHLISRITSNRPTAKLMVADLFLRTDYPDVNRMIQTNFNPFVPAIVARHAALGQQVYFLPLDAALESSDLQEGLHPNQSGYDKLAACWFNAITNLISPWGTTNPPVIADVTGGADWTNLVVSFSKPVLPAAAAPANFTVSGGVRVLGAALDPVSQREVTLTTSPQTPSYLYQVTASNICDVTPSHRAIVPGSTAAFLSAPTLGVFNNVPEATNYTLVYSLSLPNYARYNATGIPYDVDNHRAIHAFSRIAYYLELQQEDDPPQFVWVSMNAFSDDPAKIGVPAAGTGAFFQQYVTNLNVLCSVRGVVNGQGLKGGYLEFWPVSYAPDNAANVPNASSLLYDFGDQAKVGDCGSMQVHNVEAAQTIFAFNHWATGQARAIDLGIGNSPGRNPDWTFAGNASDYTIKTLQVFVLATASTNAANAP
jgi:lysophospholipase L1-like esterase